MIDTYYIGVDPDTTTTGIAIVGPRGVTLHIARARGRVAKDRFAGMAVAVTDIIRERLAILNFSPDRAVAAIEWQHIRHRERNPNSMMGVQAVAGMALSSLAEFVLSDSILLPIPSQWKGSVPKEIHQKRVLRAAGLTDDSPEFFGIPKGQRQHAIDALGLAMWARGRDE